jgi:energy-coupling factor transport system substrate-specific component
MIDFIDMWKNHKMILYVILTTVLYVLLIFPFLEFKIFGGHGDFGRVGIGIPVAFSFLFGPAAAWGAAIGNTIRDVTTSGIDSVTIFAFIANFLLGYLPYKLWNKITAEKPDLQSFKKFGLFVGLALVSCAVCGIIIGWALCWLVPSVPFMPTSLIITVTDAVWAIILGAVVLAFCYPIVSKRNLLYTDLLKIKPKKSSWTRPKSVAMLVFAVSTLICFILGAFFVVEPFGLLVFVLLSVLAVLFALKN